MPELLHGYMERCAWAPHATGSSGQRDCKKAGSSVGAGVYCGLVGPAHSMRRGHGLAEPSLARRRAAAIIHWRAADKPAPDAYPLPEHRRVFEPGGQPQNHFLFIG